MKKTLQEEKQRILEISRKVNEAYEEPMDADSDKYQRISKDSDSDWPDQPDDHTLLMTDFENDLKSLISDVFEKLYNSSEYMTASSTQNEIRDVFETVLLDVYTYRPGGVYNPQK